MTSLRNTPCPHCGQRAPIVLRSFGAACTACGGERIPFATKSVNLAGRPSKWGGSLTQFAGWATVTTGLALATGITLLLLAIWPASIVGFAIGIPMAMLSLFFGLALVLGGRRLRRHGDERAHATKVDAIRAMAEHKQGQLRAADVAGALAIDVAEADELLTELALSPPEQVSLDVDDDGQLHYLFGADKVEQLERDRWRFDAPAEPLAPPHFPTDEELTAQEAAAEAEAAVAEEAAAEAKATKEQ